MLLVQQAKTKTRSGPTFAAIESQSFRSISRVFPGYPMRYMRVFVF
jgi:hypothetical protein